VRLAALAALGLAGCNLLFDATGDGAAPPSASDEDGDAIDNAVDSCPGIDNRPGDDADGDGIGDACDPHVGASGDDLLAEEYFNGGAPSWTTPAPWTVAGGKLQVAALDGEAATVFAFDPVDAPTLELRFAAKAFAGARPSSFRVDLALDDNSGSCELISVDGRSALEQATVELDESSTAGPTGAIPPNTPVTIALTLDGDGATCRVNQQVHRIGSGIAANNTVSAKITVAGMAVEIDYALLYGFDRSATAHTSRRFDGR
jgi:hypothetical protein